MKEPHIPSLDGLRGYAAFAVLIAHLPLMDIGKVGDVFYFLCIRTNLGYFGVDVFFVLSGFLITRNLLTYKRDLKTYLKFYFNRALRIFPIYYITLLITCIFITSAGWHWNIFYLSNYYFSFAHDPHPLRHTWSLSIEEHFYILWPMIIYITINRKRELFISVLSILILLLAVWHYLLMNDREVANKLLSKSTQFRFISLVIGGYLAFYYQRLISMFKNKSTFLLIAFIIIYLSFFIVNTYSEFYYKIQLNYLVMPLLSVLLVLFCLVYRQNYFKHIFENSVVRYMGRISYGIYLYHFVVFYIFGITHIQVSNKSQSFGICMLACFMVFLISILSKHFLEEPILAMKYVNLEEDRTTK